MKTSKNRGTYYFTVYVTTLTVQSLVDVFGDFVIDWEIPNDRSEEWKVKPVFLPVSIEVINQ